MWGGELKLQPLAPPAYPLLPALTTTTAHRPFGTHTGQPKERAGMAFTSAPPHEDPGAMLVVSSTGLVSRASNKVVVHGARRLRPTPPQPPVEFCRTLTGLIDFMHNRSSPPPFASHSPTPWPRRAPWRSCSPVRPHSHKALAHFLLLRLFPCPHLHRHDERASHAILTVCLHTPPHPIHNTNAHRAGRRLLHPGPPPLPVAPRLPPLLHGRRARRGPHARGRLARVHLLVFQPAGGPTPASAVGVGVEGKGGD